jgi:hypothetical protein
MTARHQHTDLTLVRPRPDRIDAILRLIDQALAETEPEGRHPSTDEAA